MTDSVPLYLFETCLSICPLASSCLFLPYQQQYTRNQRKRILLTRNKVNYEWDVNVRNVAP